MDLCKGFMCVLLKRYFQSLKQLTLHTTQIWGCQGGCILIIKLFEQSLSLKGHCILAQLL